MPIKFIRRYRLKATLINVVRSLDFEWDERYYEGAPRVSPRLDLGDLVRKIGKDAVLDDEDEGEEVLASLGVFLCDVRLRPGTYRIDGKDVKVSGDSIRLMRQLSWRIGDTPDACESHINVDCKRPFGNRISAHNIARVLGKDEPPEDSPDYASFTDLMLKSYRGVLDAIKAAQRYGKTRPGLFESGDQREEWKRRPGK